MQCQWHAIICALRHIHHLLSQDVAHTLARSIVMSKLDYCNAVLYGSPKTTIAVLQRVQNDLARVVLLQKKYACASPLLQSLHWLPIDARVSYKLAVITYKVRSTNTPVYLSRIMSEHSSLSSMVLRSASRPLLGVRRTRTEQGRRAFHIAAPTVWNSLPTDIQLACSLNVFKKRLKTFLFRLPPHTKTDRRFVVTSLCIFGLYGTLNVDFNFNFNFNMRTDPNKVRGHADVHKNR